MAKFKYRMQNILNIKLKLETQAQIAFGNANAEYLRQQSILQGLMIRRAGFEKKLRDLMEGELDIKEVNWAYAAVENMKERVRAQMQEVQRAQRALDAARNELNRVMQERKIHEKLREKAFEAFKKELATAEAKEIDELVSYTFNAK